MHAHPHHVSGDACLEQLYPLLPRCLSGLVASMGDQWGLQVQIGHGATGLLGSLTEHNRTVLHNSADLYSSPYYGLHWGFYCTLQ